MFYRLQPRAARRISPPNDEDRPHAVMREGPSTDCPGSPHTSHKAKGRRSRHTVFLPLLGMKETFVIGGELQKLIQH